MTRYHKRTNELGTYVVEITEHPGGEYTIGVKVPGLPLRRDNDHSFSTDGQALAAGDELALRLME